MLFVYKIPYKHVKALILILFFGRFSGIFVHMKTAPDSSGAASLFYLVLRLQQ